MHCAVLRPHCLFLLFFFTSSLNVCARFCRLQQCERAHVRESDCFKRDPRSEKIRYRVCVLCTVLHNTKANLVLTRSLTTVATTSEPAKLTRSTLHCTYRHLFLRQPWPPAARRSEQTSAQMNRYYLVSNNHQICVSCC